MLKKVVVDTNVIISGSIGKGSPSKVLDLIEKGKVTLYVSERIIEEYWEIILRVAFSESLKARTIIRSILEGKQVLLVKPQKHFTVVKDDPDDNMFIDCAMESGANYIITGDKHLLNLGHFGYVQILSPGDFLKKMRIGKGDAT